MCGRTLVAFLLLSSSALAQSVIVGNGSQEQVSAGGQVVVGPAGIEVQPGGKLELSGTAASPALLTSGQTSGVSINVTGGTIDFKYGRLESVTTLTIGTSSTVLRIHDTVFTDLAGLNPGATPWIDLSGLTSSDREKIPFSFNRVSFIDPQGSPTRTTIKAVANTPAVRCLGNSTQHGNRWGEAFDDDGSDKVTWHTGGISRSGGATFDTLEDALKDSGTSSSSTLTVTSGANAFVDDFIDWNLCSGSGSSGPIVLNASLAPMVGLAVFDSDGGTAARGKLVNSVVARGGIDETTAENCTLFDPGGSAIAVSNTVGTNLLIESGFTGSGNSLTTSITTASASFFQSATGYDFHLVSPGGDAAIDEGSVLSTTADFEGHTRGINGKAGGVGTWDAGADEYVAPIPPVPTNLLGSWSNVSGISTLTWDESIAAASYNVYRRTSGSYGAPLANVTTLSHGDSTVAPSTTYFYVVRAVGSAGESANSNEVTVITGPPAPGGFQGTAQSTTSILWEWTDVAGETGYELHDDAHVVKGTAGQNGVSVLEALLSENTPVSRHVHGLNGTVLGFASATLVKHTKVHDPITADMTLTPVSPSKIQVTVTPPPNSGLPTACEIDRSPDGLAGWVNVKAFDADYSKLDTGLTTNTTYFYRVRYRNADLVPTVYLIKSATTLPPQVPEGFVGIPQTTTSILWQWNNVDEETGFEVHDDSHFVKGSSAADILEVSEGNFTENSLASRHVHSKIGAVFSAASNTATRYTKVHNPVLADFSLTAVSHARVDITVVPPPNSGGNSTACEIGRSENQSDWNVVKGFGVAGFTFQDTTVSGTTTYYYRIRYQNGDASAITEYSLLHNVTTPPPPPGTFAATPLSTTSIRWHWVDIAGETSYEVHTDNHGIVGTTAADATEFIENGLLENTRYSRHAHSKLGAIASEATATIGRYTLLHTPLFEEFSLAILSSTEVSISVIPPRNSASSLTACEIQRSTDGTNWTTAKSFTISGYNFTDGGRTPGVTYSYRVRYRNGDGTETLPSQVKQVTTPLTGPANFAGTAQSTSSILWTWSDGSGETGYDFHDDAHTLSVVRPADSVSYTETGLSENALARRHVHSVAAGGASSPSSSATVYTKIRNAGTGDFSVVALSATQVDVLVTPPPNGTSGSTGCQIERQPDLGAWSVVRAYSNEYSFRDSGLAANTTYHYRITYRNGNGTAALTSPSKSARTETPAAPAGFAGSAQSTTTIQWTWGNVTGETNFDLHDAAEAVKRTLVADVLTFTEEGLSENSAYTRHVHAVNGTLVGLPSNTVTTYSRVHEPTLADFAPHVISSTRIDVVVKPPPNPTSGLTGCEIDREVSAGVWATIKPFSNTYTFSDTPLVPSLRYVYRIRYRNGDGVVSLNPSPSQGATIATPQIPANFAGTVQSSSSLLWSWTDVEGETRYDLHDAAEAVKGTTNPNIISLQETALSENTSYTRHVHAVNGIGSSGGSNSVMLATKVHDPTESDFTALVVSATSIEITVATPINGSTAPSGCKIERSEDNVNWTMVKDFSTVYTFTDTTVSSGGAYRYRIFYRNLANTVTPESPSKVVRMVPDLLSPVPGGATSDTTPSFDWTDVPGKPALTYEIQATSIVLTDGTPDWTPATLSINETGLTNSSHTPAGALAQGIYYWRVRAKFAGANLGPYSTVSSFRIDTIGPGLATLASPANGSYVGTANPSFDWSDVTDLSGVSYRLQVDNDADFSSPVVNVGEIAASAYTAPIPLAAGLYHWRVQATDRGGNAGSYTTAWSFTVDVTPPAAVSLLAPANRAVVSQGSPLFDWSDASDPSGVTYRIQIATEQTFASPLATDQAGLSTSSFVPVPALADGSYVWRVLSTDGAGNTSTSAMFQFTVDLSAAPAAPTVDLSSYRKTKDTTPTITGKSTELGITINVYFGSSFDGSVTASPTTGDWSYTPTLVRGEGSYVVHARSTNTNGDSSSSNAVVVTIDTSVNPPTNLTAAALDGEVHLTWVASPDADVIGYEVWRSANGGSFSKIHTGLVVGTTYCDSTADNGTPYCYRVRAVDDTLQEGP